ncbi:serine/threonine-protein kinase [Tabrizicola sp. YIM 78059]|uniref:serine/threonine-protein kinase n=1 Tax=Tabrizicola sp. YIM 78059 TaxID=2529861 RepID=UPI0010A9AF51|nr:serine/threonine-protein kinase [Tabrizicola sp. YIM 78059]
MALDRLSDDLEITDELPVGTTIFHGQYRITKFLNSGGFGITYLAKDSLNRDVVLKECFVGAFCRRSQTRVRPRSESGRVHLGKVMRGFLREAHTLAAMSHPNIVRVHQVFEDNDTAYMALDYVRGYDLLQVVDEGKMHLAAGQLVDLARKLLSALDHIHQRGMLHCDVSPDNICLSLSGEPVLIDFGAVRSATAQDASLQTGLSMVKDGYSPYELYSGGATAGPWSDLYALGATLYHAITGAAPADCQSRLSAAVERRPDPVTPLAGRFAGYPAGFLESIDRAMSVRPSARVQSARDWLSALAPRDTAGDRSIVLLRKAPVTGGSVRPVRPVRPG